MHSEVAFRKNGRLRMSRRSYHASEKSQSWEPLMSSCISDYLTRPSNQVDDRSQAPPTCFLTSKEAHSAVCVGDSTSFDLMFQSSRPVTPSLPPASSDHRRASENPFFIGRKVVYVQLFACNPYDFRGSTSPLLDSIVVSIQACQNAIYSAERLGPGFNSRSGSSFNVLTLNNR
ncbi:hypothetical protein PROFUN_03331 [Planoprotostelium fungivorum]|uniref:Uncharacterized protein n=1 Tax=Planoprotostelium fungivorum TaxID=1890364 RepID=A0A2P6NWT4_9EUKA|nr:hypothetical protein PROFUN_03331 [Planoprotostelium fungivorum]